MHSSENRPSRQQPKHKKDRRNQQEERKNEFDRYSRGDFKVPKFTPLTHKQGILFKEIINNPLSIATGPAGTAKSYTGAAAAIHLLVKGEIDKIIVTRNPVPTGFTTGLKPGTSDEKLAPWVAPILDNLKQCCESEDGGYGFYNYLVGTGKIRAVEMESIKGTNIRNAFFLVEESQECSLEQLKNLVTRSCEGSFVFLDGDVAQGNKRIGGSKDFHTFVDSVKSMNDKLDRNQIALGCSDDWADIRVPVVEFDKNDNVRSGISRWMLEMFEAEGL